MESADGTKEVRANHFINGQRSTMFDAFFISGGAESIKTLKKIGHARFWVKEAFGHLKAIGAIGEGIELVGTALAEVENVKLADVGSGTDELLNWYGVITAASPKTGSTIKDTSKLVKGTKDFASEFFPEISQRRNFFRELDGYAEQVSM